MTAASKNMSPDQIEIEKLVHCYCDALCRRDHDAWVETLAEAAVSNGGPGDVVGHNALSAAFLRIMALFAHVLQLTHKDETKVDGDTSRGHWYITDVRPYCEGKAHVLYRVLR